MDCHSEGNSRGICFAWFKSRFLAKFIPGGGLGMTATGRGEGSPHSARFGEHDNFSHWSG